MSDTDQLIYEIACDEFPYPANATAWEIFETLDARRVRVEELRAELEHANER